MPCSLSVPLRGEIIIEAHEIEGGGFWAEVPQLPGCVAQAETIEELKGNIARAILDWLAEPGVKTEADARRLAALQGSQELPDESYPQHYDDNPPPSWSDEDDFDREVARGRANPRLMALLDERARQTETVPLEEVRRRLGLE